MTDAHKTLNETLSETSRITLKCQHNGLDALQLALDSYRVSLRTQPDNGCARVGFLKDAQNVIGMLACADGRQTVVRELRQAINVDGILAPSFDELVQIENAEEREGLVNDVLAAADTLVDQGLCPIGKEARDAVTEIESAVHALSVFDDELDESDDDEDQDEEPTEQTTVILPPAMTLYERKTLAEFFKTLGLMY